MGNTSQMLANIFEQPDVADRCLSLDLQMPTLPDVDRVIFSACGTSRHAGMVGRSWYYRLLHLPTHLEDAADGYPMQVPPRSLIYLLSQSGQTKDVINVAERFPQAIRWGITNGSNTKLHDLTDYTLQTPAGEEKAVAATKTFLAQLILLLRVALEWNDRSDLNIPEATNLHTQLAQLPRQIQTTLQHAEANCQAVAQKLADSNRLILLGSGINTAIALEGALKLKETVYLHAEGLSSGDFMHGPIAIIDSGFPVITIAIPSSATYKKTLAEAQRVKSYGAYLVGITTESAEYDADLFDVVLTIADVDEVLSPLLTVLPLQLLAYYTAKNRGLNIDAPRNLTKFIG